MKKRVVSANTDIDFSKAWSYIIEFLVGKENLNHIIYGNPSQIVSGSILIVKSDFWNNKNYGSITTIPQLPLKLLPNDIHTPFLFGEDKVIVDSDNVIIYADLIASSYFLLSRYEEIIHPECRDQYGRFCGSDAVIFQQGYALRPIIDEYSAFLSELLVRIGHKQNVDKIDKIYLTHDVDHPFMFYRCDMVIKQWIKNLLHIRTPVHKCFEKYVCSERDPYNTFDRIFDYDNKLKEKYGDHVENICFIIAAKGHLSNEYVDLNIAKFRKLIRKIVDNNCKVGIHLSFEAGEYSKLIHREISRLPDEVDKTHLISRNHFLRWIYPEDVDVMEYEGIQEDYTLGYADQVGFRVGTCRPYKFINPYSGRVSKVTEIPLEIMDGTLDGYMHLSKEKAVLVCKQIIDQVYKYHGALNVLWHNTSFIPGTYRETVYNEMISYILKLN